MSTFSNLRLSKINPKRDFWFVNKPSANPGTNVMIFKNIFTKKSAKKAICDLKQS
jgi:hypothetical protein